MWDEQLYAMEPLPRQAIDRGAFSLWIDDAYWHRTAEDMNLEADSLQIQDGFVSRAAETTLPCLIREEPGSGLLFY